MKGIRMTAQTVQSQSPGFLDVAAKISQVTLLVIGAAICWVALTSATEAKMLKLRNEANQPVSYKVATTAQRERQLACLAQNIYHEAGYESFEGKVAVAQVTLNRAASGRFPDDICGVVYQRNYVMEKVVCQFSWYCQSPSIRKPLNDATYRESMEVAKKVLLEGFKLDGIKDALFFHADYINPKWDRQKVAQIGRHIFYR